ncbi:hypothetical protein E2562_005404 [Oryza meyeriana var. granulata]|uniref:Uncharacterized protein n=1 Tax=Oryza meyeriana var. granulata TaxID=110450 RepID=A0A6G1DEZ4_9ORYZ|nr:hypothetical protein E2562_005404 [Oryza meyeriana var. granulata]
MPRDIAQVANRLILALPSYVPRLTTVVAGSFTGRRREGAGRPRHRTVYLPGCSADGRTTSKSGQGPLEEQWQSRKKTISGGGGSRGGRSGARGWEADAVAPGKGGRRGGSRKGGRPAATGEVGNGDGEAAAVLSNRGHAAGDRVRGGLATGVCWVGNSASTIN